MGISPDFPAWVNYALVLLLGCWTWWIGDRGYAQTIRKEPLRLTSLCWYFLLGCDILFPVALFWVLDWTGAVVDTSLFAALITVFVYVQSVPAGNKEAGTLASVFARISSVLTQRVTETIARRKGRNDRFIKEATAKDPVLLKTLLDAAYLETENRGVLDLRLAELKDKAKDSAGTENTEDYARRASAYLHRELQKSRPDYDDFLKEKGFIHWQHYWAPLPGTATMAMTAVIVLALTAWASSRPTPSPRVNVETRYFSWRLDKAGHSAGDNFRTKKYFLDLLSRTDRNGPTMTDDQLAAVAELGVLLSYPGVSDRGASDITDLLVHTHHGWPLSPFLAALLEGSRNTAAHARAASQDALLQVARSRGPVPKALAERKLSAKDSQVAVDAFIGAWRAWIATARSVPVPKTVPAVGL